MTWMTPLEAMMSVAMPQSELTSLLPSGVSLSAVNSPLSCVVAGEVSVIETFATALAEREVAHKRLDVSHAFHSPLMEQAAAEFLEVARRVTKKYKAIMDSRDNVAVKRTLGRLEQAATTENDNLLPYLVDCCHAYATVGEMVGRLKRQWGEFQEPVGL